MKKLNYLFIMFMIICLNLSSAKGEDLSTIIKDDFKAFTNDFGNMGKVLNMSHLLYAGGFIATDIAIIQADERIRDYFKKNQTNFLDNYFGITNNFGELYSALGIPVGTYLVGYVTDNYEVRKTGRQMAEAMIISTLTAQSIKMLLGRSRPFIENGSDHFQFFQLHEPNISHPSGHTTVAFTIATVLAFNIDEWWAYTGFYALAASTGLARIYLDKHWASDVFMGAVIGTSSALLVLKASEITEKNRNSSGFNITPSVNVINISYSF